MASGNFINQMMPGHVGLLEITYWLHCEASLKPRCHWGQTAVSFAGAEIAHHFKYVSTFFY